MKEPLRLVRPTGRALRHLRAVKRRFHIRAFGEELARVNLDFSPEEQRAYLAWMRNYARKKGVPPAPSYSVGWMLKLEEELNRNPVD